PPGFPIPPPPCFVCRPNGTPGFRMNASSFESGDHVGLASQSTLGDTYATFRVFTSYRPMSEWFSRMLTNAIFEPSGDHVGWPLLPHSLMNGIPPESIRVGGASFVVRAR